MTAIDSVFVTRHLLNKDRFIQNQAVPLISLMELLGPGGALERLHYEKLPRKAQYEVIKEVLWTAYQDTWRLDWTTLSHEKKLRKRPTMKYAMKNLLEHLGLNKSQPPARKSRKRTRRVPPLGAGFGGLKRRDIEKQPLRSNVEIFLPSIAEEEPAHKSSFKQLQKHSLFFRPSGKLKNLMKSDPGPGAGKLERIRIAAGLRTRNQILQRKDELILRECQHNTKRSSVQHVPQIPTHFDNKYGSGRYSVFDPMGDYMASPVDMELKAKLGRPEFSPSINYRAGNMYNFENRSYERMKKKLRRQYYKNMTDEEKKKYKEERATRRAMRAANGEELSSESDLSGDDSLSDVDPQEYQNFILEKQRRRAHKNMLKAAGEDPGYDSDEFEDEYWAEKKGNIPLDMQRRLGFAQILAPGPELLDISLPKDEEAKQKVLEMFKDVLKDELQDMVDGFDLDSDEEDPDALDDDEIEKMLASGVDIGNMLSMQDLSPETRKKRMKQIARYKKYKEIAEKMGPGVSVADVKKNVKRMLQKAKSNNLVFDEDGKLKHVDFTDDMIEQSARSVMGGKFTGKDLIRDLQSAAEVFDKELEKKQKRKAKKKAKAKAERDARRAKGEIVESPADDDDSSDDEDPAERKLRKMKKEKKKLELAQKTARNAEKQAKRERQQHKIKIKAEQAQRRNDRKLKNAEKQRRRDAGESDVSSDECDSDSIDLSSDEEISSDEEVSIISSDSSEDEDLSESSGVTVYEDVSVYSSSEATEYDSDGNVTKARKERTRKVVKMKSRAKFEYQSSVDTIYDDDGNVLQEHQGRKKVVVVERVDEHGNIVKKVANEEQMKEFVTKAEAKAEAKAKAATQAKLQKEDSSLAPPETVLRSSLSRSHSKIGNSLSRSGSMADRPPWRSGAVRDQSSRNSVTSSYRALHRAPKIGAPKKSRKGRRESKYDFADLAPLRLEDKDDGSEFDWGQFGISNSPTKTPDFAKMEEELKQLELAENFEAAAELRQKIRDMKREERKRIIRKQKEDENMAQKEKDERLFNKKKRQGDLADMKANIALQRLEAKKAAERKQKERQAMLDACQTDEERQALLDKWEAERLAEEAEAERLRLLALEQRKIQIALLKKQYALRKKLQKWRDLQLESFTFKRTQSINRPFVYSHLPGPPILPPIMSGA